MPTRFQSHPTLGVAAALVCACAEPANRNPTQTAASNAAAPAAASATPLTRQVSDASLQWVPCPEIFPAGCEISVLQGNPAAPNADVFLRVPAGYAIPAHRHTSAERMVLVEGELAVQYQGAERQTLSAGEYAYGPAGLAHNAVCQSQGPCTLFIAFEGPVDATAVDALD
jgi:quercetin dioxygenase-like cupin family protein